MSASSVSTDCGSYETKAGAEAIFLVPEEFCSLHGGEMTRVSINTLRH